jgi:hypothetical protein
VLIITCRGVQAIVYVVDAASDAETLEVSHTKHESSLTDHSYTRRAYQQETMTRGYTSRPAQEAGSTRKP